MRLSTFSPCWIAYLICANAYSQSVKPLPRLQYIEPGKVILGTTADEAFKLISWLAPASPRDRETVARSLSAELVDRHREVDLPGFYIGTHEVTNREFFYFLESTRNADAERSLAYRFPFSWWSDEDFRSRAKEINDSRLTKLEYWERHWQNLKWHLPEELEDMPVGSIPFRTAQAYARWAGMRLPNEAQWIRAAVGDQNVPYIWGAPVANETRDAWLSKVLTLLCLDEPQRDEFSIAFLKTRYHGKCLKPVGITQQGSRFGVHDLHGNVMEWIQQPFLPLAEQQQSLEALRKALKNTPYADMAVHLNPPDWQADRIIGKGGSFYQAGNPVLTALSYRVDWRYAYSVDGWSEGMGFRVVHSAIPGQDALAGSFEDRPVLGGTYEVDIAKAVGIEAWDRDEKNRIRRYSVVALGPSTLGRKLSANQKRAATLEPGFETWAGENRFPVGVLTTSEPIAELDLPPGDYSIWYWNPSAVVEKRTKDKPENNKFAFAPELSAKIDGKRPVYLFQGRDGKWASAIPTNSPQPVTAANRSEHFRATERSVDVVDIEFNPVVPYYKKAGSSESYQQFSVRFSVRIPK